jgi:hypothetical protein
MLDWMNSGPGQLDLATPLMEGEKTGTAMAEQQERVRSDYANEQAMTTKLGLEAKQQDWEHSVWNSQADMRASQLEISQNAAQEGATKLDYVAQDHDTLGQVADDIASANKSGDPNAFTNRPVRTFFTDEGQKQSDNLWNQALNSDVGRAALTHVQQVALFNKSQTDAQTGVLSEAMKAGIPLSYTTAPDGSQAIDYTGMAKATVAAGVAVKGQEAQQSAGYLAAQMRAQASMYTADTRAKSYATAAGLKASTGDYKTDMDSINKAELGGLIPEKDADEQRQAARYRRDNPGQTGAQPQGTSTVTPMSNNKASLINGAISRGLTAPGSPVAPPAPNLAAPASMPASSLSPAAWTSSSRPQGSPWDQ